jgi:hypothetical protein
VLANGVIRFPGRRVSSGETNSTHETDPVAQIHLIRALFIGVVALALLLSNALAGGL